MTDESENEQRENESNNSEVRFGSKTWIRTHWDEEHETAPGIVLLIKFLHEAPVILVYPLVGAFFAGSAFWVVGADQIKVLSSALTIFLGYFALLHRRWACMTVTVID